MFVKYLKTKLYLVQYSILTLNSVIFSISMDELIKITVFDREDKQHVYEIPHDIGISVMELCKANDLPILATCGGMALCATCHVLVESDTLLPDMQDDEAMMLDQLPNMADNSRLSCQLKINENFDGLVVRLAEE